MSRPYAVLVVDDELAITTMVADILYDQSGIPVFVAHDADAALAVYAANRDKIGVALIDMILGPPAELNGLALAARLRQENPDMMLVAFTGYVDEFTPSQFRQYGFCDWFSKPFKVELILDVVGCAVRRYERWQSGK